MSAVAKGVVRQLLQDYALSSDYDLDSNLLGNDITVKVILVAADLLRIIINHLLVLQTLAADCIILPCRTWRFGPT